MDFCYFNLSLPVYVFRQQYILKPYTLKAVSNVRNAAAAYIPTDNVMCSINISFISNDCFLVYSICCNSVIRTYIKG